VAAWQLETSGIVQENLRSQAILNPSLFSPTLLNAGGDSSQSKEWQALWSLHEKAREVPLENLGVAKGGEPFWLSEEAGWIGLAVPLGASGERVVLARNVREVAAQIATLLQGISGIPGYLSISVEFCGKEVFGGSAGEAVLATAKAEQNVAVRAGLKDRAALYTEFSRRAWVFGSLILASTICTIWAFVANCKALERQHRLNEIKTNFVSSVSHELRAPIASVRLMAESLSKGRVTGEKQGEYFKFITQECKRLGTLIENVLDISRIEQSRRAYEFAPVNVGALVNETVEGMRPVALEKGVELELTASASAKLQEFELDAGAMQQAVVNLVDNAIKHAPAGSRVSVMVGVERGRLSIAVKDEGEGIPASEREKIFERFYRSGSELRRKTPGVGIGLSIVKHIVEGHRGKVELESAPGSGSCFRIVIPNQQT
jgi:two-component system phosphate regulon sensor histidine kinase PhoR